MSFSRLADAVGFVRGHPQMFFPQGVPNPLHCAQHLVAEVLALGGSDVCVERNAGWWVVSSSFDWFVSDLSEDDQFRRLVPLPEVGANASRVEIVLAAFAEAVATRSGSEPWRLIVGTETPVGVAQGAHRLVAFRFP